MKKAIITGATGLVGSEVARYLASSGVNVLCLGQQRLDQSKILQLFGTGVAYMNLKMDEMSMLPSRLEEISWLPDSATVFFNFAWRGHQSLTDGSFADQIDNATHAADAVRVAKRLGCIRFVNAGTLEESFIESFLQGSCDVLDISNQTNYALAKLASRDMCKVVAYLEKIDYIHTRLSVPLTPDLSRGTYIATTFKKIMQGQPYEAPQNKGLFDIILTDDVARAYYMIGNKGRNKGDYFIGTSKPATLAQYFAQFEKMVQGMPVQLNETFSEHDIQLFSTYSLYQDTGFVASSGFEKIIKHMVPA